jgi:hypothetical protein
MSSSSKLLTTSWRALRLVLACAAIFACLVVFGSHTPALAHGSGGPEYLFIASDALLDDRIQEVSDTSDVTLAMEFKPEVAGTVSGVRICLDLDATEINARLPLFGYLWDADGNLLASGGAFEGITTASPCFYEIGFGPISVTANTRYVIGFWLRGGQYSYVDQGFDGDISNATTGHLIAPSATNSLRGNGLFAYTSEVGTSAPFPVDTWHNSNYLVSPRFTPAPH